MAVTVDWATKTINVPQADLTLVSGTFYTLDTEWFKNALRALEASEYGMPNLRMVDHNTEYEVAGVTYARKVEIVNGYSVTFEDGQYSVQLNGSNNNIWDIQNGVLNQNQVQVIPTNAAGLINVVDITTVRKANVNKVTRTGDIITIYDDDGITIWKQIDLADGGRVEV